MLRWSNHSYGVKGCYADFNDGPDNLGRYSVTRIKRRRVKPWSVSFKGKATFAKATSLEWQRNFIETMDEAKEIAERVEASRVKS